VTVPVRTCAGCGRRAPQAELLRFTASDGVLVADESRRLPGRGVYTCRSAACFAQARERNAFTRRLRATVRVSDGLKALFPEG
jgi:predicted RNA-binding protein YlxR (DUF448 family)